MTTRPGPFDRADFPFALRLVTEAAAIAAHDWVGRSKKEDGDGAAVEAMRKALGSININAIVMIGEGEKDNAPLLYRGERIGAGEPEIEIAVDPIEGTTNMANGTDNSMAVMALAPRGAMFDLGPSFYMDKLVLPAPAKGKVDPTWPVKKKLEALAAALNKPVSDLRIFVLNRKRHHAMIKEIHDAGARTVLQENGDVAGAFMAVQKGSSVDALFGTGGSPEGIITAIFVRAMGGEFFGRVDPQGDEEAQKVKAFGLDSGKWLSGTELVKSDDAVFVATGINSGPVCRGVSIQGGTAYTHSVILMAKTGARYDISSRFPRSLKQSPAMSPREVAIKPFDGQKPGTSGLRKKVSVFRQPGYLEAFVQAVFDTQAGLQGGTLVLGGDGRFFNREAIRIILRMAAANGVARVLVGQGGILSTPAASAVIRARQAQGGLVLSASHNPGGPDGDFGIKFNIANGGPAPEAVTEAIYQRTRSIDRYRTLEVDAPNLDRIGESKLGSMTVSVFDPVADYAALLQTLFDFDAIRRLIAMPGFRFRFDAMHAVTGPYAKRLFIQMLGASAASVINAEPKEDFGGGHPDPNPVYAPELYKAAVLDGTLDFAAASDGDGDRNMILGKGIAVSPSDSLAVLAANATLVPGYTKGISGVARSMPTSRASDAVAAALGIESFETPTGWKFFGNLMDSGRITLCGEESYGTSSSHVREKDGLWAVLFWLNLLAARPGETVLSLLQAHWKRFGRHYYSRHDYEAVDATVASRALDRLRAALPDLAGTAIGGMTVTATDDFAYTDPIDASVSKGQGLRVICGEQARLIARLSGTGTEGATVRLYFELFEAEPARQGDDVQARLQPLIAFAERQTGLCASSGRTGPDVIT